MMAGILFKNVLISLAVEKFWLGAGQLLEESDKGKPFVGALRKVKKRVGVAGVHMSTGGGVSGENMEDLHFGDGLSAKESRR